MQLLNTCGNWAIKLGSGDSLKRQVWRTVTSINPKQLARAAPAWLIAFAYSCIFSGLNRNWFHCGLSLVVLVISKMHNFVGDHAGNGDRSSKSCSHVAESTGISKASKKLTQSFNTITILLCWHLRTKVMPKASANLEISCFSTRNSA